MLQVFNLTNNHIREKLLDAMLYAAVNIVETCSGNDEQLLDLAMKRLYFFWVTSAVPGKDMWNRFGVCTVIPLTHRTNLNL